MINESYIAEQVVNILLEAKSIAVKKKDPASLIKVAGAWLDFKNCLESMTSDEDEKKNGMPVGFHNHDRKKNVES